MSVESTGIPAHTIEQLSKRYRDLNEKQIQAKRDFEHAQDRLDELKKRAKQDYDTDDLEKLTKLLEEMKAKNEEQRATYQASLDEIESELEKIDTDYRTNDMSDN